MLWQLCDTESAEVRDETSAYCYYVSPKQNALDVYALTGICAYSKVSVAIADLPCALCTQHARLAPTSPSEQEWECSVF